MAANIRSAALIAITACGHSFGCRHAIPHHGPARQHSDVPIGTEKCQSEEVAACPDAGDRFRVHRSAGVPFSRKHRLRIAQTRAGDNQHSRRLVMIAVQMFMNGVKAFLAPLSGHVGRPDYAVKLPGIGFPLNKGGE